MTYALAPLSHGLAPADLHNGPLLSITLRSRFMPLCPGSWSYWLLRDFYLHEQDSVVRLVPL
jgi:hypothetical protein